MSKEEIVPINITFISHRIQINVQKKITMQMVLYRNNKATKGQMKKYEGKKSAIQLEESLYFNSTLQKSNGLYLPKTINIKLACKVDSQQYQFQQSLNISDFVQKSAKQYALVFNKNSDVRLFYSFFTTIGGELQKNDVQKHLTMLPIKGQKQKTAKKIKFNLQPNKQVIVLQQNYKQNNDEWVSPTFKKTSRSCNSGQTPQPNIIDKQQVSRNVQRMKTCFDKQNKAKSKTKTENLGQKQRKQTQKKSALEEYKEKNRILHEQNRKFAEKNQLLTLDLSTYKNQFDQQERKIMGLKNQIKELQKKNVIDKPDVSVAVLTQNVKSLQKQLKQNNQKYSSLEKKYKQLEKNLKQKSRTLDECNTRIKHFSDKNVELSHKLAQSIESCDKYKQYSQQLEQAAQKLRNQLKCIRQAQNKSNLQRNSSLMSSTGSNTADKQQKMKLQSQLEKQRKQKSSLEQQLAQKQKLIKILTDCKNDIERQKNEEIEIIRNELAQLRNQTKNKSHFTLANNNGMDALEFKVNMQKNRKQIQILKKTERSLMIQKNQLDSKNKTLQQEVIKVKQKLASLMNAIHQNTEQQTAQQIFKCIE